MKRTWLSLIIAIAGLSGALALAPSVAALEVPPRPTDIPIVDQSGTLTDEQKANLARQIAAERETSGNQIAIVMIPSLEDEALEDYSIKVARAWGVGTKENDNGVLLVIAKDDRRLRIEVGRGLEGVLTDVQSARIIRSDIAPQFRNGKYYEGIQAGLTSITKAIHGEYTASDTTSQSSDTSFPWEAIALFGFMAFSWLGSVLARTKSWWLGGVIGAVAGGAIGLIMASLIVGLIGVLILTIVGLLLDKAVSRNYQEHARRGDAPSWWAGGPYIGGGSGSGGGFGGFGGGGFGGGGASGDW